jgi:antitoxin VapB
MATTRAFKSGNSQAVRIPAEIAFEDGQELDITRHGDVVMISPRRDDISEALARLKSLPKPPTVVPIDRTDVPDRERY